MKLPEVKLAGSHYEMGYKHGSSHKQLIADVVAKFFRCVDFMISAEGFPIKSSREMCLKLSKRCLPYAEEYAPHLVEEVRGIADGGGISFEEALSLNCMFEMFDLAVPAIRAGLLGCTSFAASRTATAHGEALIGQTYDIQHIFRKHGIILRIEPENGPTCLVYALTGTVGQLGFNSAGIALVSNYLMSKDARAGVPTFFILRNVLHQDTIADAISAVTQARRAKGWNYMLCSQEGEIIDIETTATAFEVQHAREDHIGHSNHYLSERLKQYDVRVYDHTFLRQGRIDALLRQKLGKITIKDLQDFTRDHVGYPSSICRHDGDDPFSGVTLASVIMQPARATAWLSPGCPCENKYYEIVL